MNQRWVPSEPLSVLASVYFFHLNYPYRDAKKTWGTGVILSQKVNNPAFDRHGLDLPSFSKDG